MDVVRLGAQSKVGRYLNGIYHPVRLRDVAAQVSFQGVRPGRPFEVGPYRVRGVALNHPGGSCGYRVEVGGKPLIVRAAAGTRHPGSNW